METQDFNKELLDYLYGEMTADEKVEFEKKLSGDSDLQKELDALKSVRQELDKLKDKEVMEPFSAWEKSRSSGWIGSNYKRRIIVFRPITAVAASLLILMLVGFITNFSISLNEQGLYLGFENQTSTEKSIIEENVKDLIRKELVKNNTMLMTKLSESENSSNDKFVALETTVEKAIKTHENGAVTNEDLQKFFTSAENKNSEMMKNYLKLTTVQQQEYFKTMLTQFNDFMQEQRNDDLTMIRNSLIELKQSQNIQKKETNQMIASILTSVSQ